MKYAAWSILALMLVAPAATRSAASERDSRVAGPFQVMEASIAVSCPLTVGGGFEAKTTALAGELALEPDQKGVVSGELTVDLRTLQTGISLRDTHMREKYLEVQRGEDFATATLDNIRLEGIDPSNPGGKAKFRGRLMLHGEEREVLGTAEIRRTDQGLSVKATFPLKVSDFEIPSPTYLGVGVRNDISIAVNFRVAPKHLQTARAELQ